MMMEHVVKGDIEKAKKVSDNYDSLFKVLFITSNPSPVKAALSMKGFNTSYLRLPLVQVDEKEKQEIKRICNQFKLLGA